MYKIPKNKRNIRLFYIFLIMLTIATTLFWCGGWGYFADIIDAPQNPNVSMDQQLQNRFKGSTENINFFDQINYINLFMHSLYFLSIIPLMLLVNLPSPSEILAHIYKKIYKHKHKDL